MKAEWISVDDERPQYYHPVLCYGYCSFYHNPHSFVCWLASDGEKDIYTISGTDYIINNVTHWMPLPEPPLQTNI